MAQVLDLNACDKICLGCIKSYKSKHTLQAGEKFKINCSGIPLNYISSDLKASIPADQLETAMAMVDPVTWASTTLDWHCLDPDGQIWKRKNPQEYDEWIKHNPETPILGHSRYHRPYQVTMLRCTAKRKVFRIGRQCGKTESIVVSILYNMFTKPGKNEDEAFNIILITPFQAQIELIFKRLLELLNSQPGLANSIQRCVKAPNYTLTLWNQSEIKGFTAGTQSGGNANAVRGQHGDMLVFDEADMLSAGDMASALSIITNSPGASIWMSSTPTGRREQFYKTCNSKLYKEFHYPSQVNPMWNSELEETFRTELTDIDYKHEILADFGEQEEGVFQNSYIQAAKSSYNYGQMAYNPTWTYTIGVDWNDVRNGTTIAVAGYNPATNHFFLVNRYIVSREGWTQLTACQKIADLNRIWNPAVIYIDKGFGGTQDEVLRKYGYDALRDPTRGASHPDSKLRHIVKQYDFGSKIQVHDLFTKQPIDKQAKSFLVENAVRRFETKMVSFPDSDESLEEQLAGYIVDRVTPTGNPVYKAGNEQAGDHMLDALMLALVGFTLEKTDFGSPKYSAHIAFSGQFGERIAPDVHNGDLVVQAGKQKNERNERRPIARAEVTTEKTLLGSTGSLPANHVNPDHGKIGIWAWDGYNRDEPRPKVRTLTEATKDAEKRLGMRPNRGRAPKRRNI